MKLEILNDLDEEHRVIEEAAGSLVTFGEEVKKDKVENAQKELKDICDYFQKFFEEYHFKKETEILMDVLVAQGIPRDKGPLHFYLLEHDNHNEYLAKLQTFAQKETWSNRDKDAVAEITEKFCAEIWEHIDKEDSVLFPEMEERIRGKYALQVEEKRVRLEESSNRDWFLRTGKDFISRYKPADYLPDVIRGDGCMSCRHYGEGCHGIEHEWWTEHEWEDFFARNNKD